MTKRKDRPLRYGFVLLVFVLGGMVLSFPIVGESPGTPPLVCFFLILLSAWYGGLGPGLLATALIALVTMSSSYPVWRVVRLGLFLMGGVAVSALAEALHVARRRADESRRALAAVLISIGDGVIATDKLGRVTFANPLAGSLTGWDPADVVGRPLGEVCRLVDETSRRPVDDPVALVLRNGDGDGGDGDDGGKEEGPRLLIARDGTERPIDDSAAPVRDEEGRTLGAVLVFRDDTARREYERRLLENSRRKDEFLAMLAHELRNPLGAIRAAVAVLGTPAEDSHLSWSRDVLSRQVGQLGQLLDDLLDVARVTHGQVILRRKPLDADSALRHACAAVRPLMEERGHHLDVVMGSGSKAIEADPVRLEQILVNLLGNAARYTPNGGRVKVSSAREADEVIIEVEDNGSGISPEVLPRIFDLFTQGERSLARTEGGLGIGLTVVKSLVEQHGGRVLARSRGQGQGSCFVVRLPAARADSNSSPADPAAPEPSSSSSHEVVDPGPESRQPGTETGTRTRVLIIDDNQDLVRSLARLLGHVGHEVRTAYDGPEGIEAAHAYDPDVLLLDIGLPNLDGYEVARRLRHTENARRSLMIAISGYGQEEDLRRSREAGIDHYLIKPVDIKTITSLIAQSRRQGEGA